MLDLIESVMINILQVLLKKKTNLRMFTDVNVEP